MDGMKVVLLMMLLCFGSTHVLGQDGWYLLNSDEQLFSVNRISTVEDTPFRSESDTNQVFVDTSVLYSLPYRSPLFPIEYDEDNNALVGQKNIGVYPLTIRNDSENPWEIQIEDEQLVLIQEAVDSLGNWQPIEYFIHSTCGVSYTPQTLVPNEQLMALIAKYEGEYRTRLRVKVVVDGVVRCSNEFWGSVNYNQFVPQEDNTVVFH